MEKDNKILLGKLLGEIYRLQKNTSEMAFSASFGQRYGLLNGFEDAIDHELEMIGFVSQDELNNVGKILDEVFFRRIENGKFQRVL
ncbi:hypothetical protein SAMN06265348_105419 [Pedobacter westerhofensis]|uniref:Uncharacterized protein n=1 Tax=Pedobacter westerhofensis TaxID=425512 RepID=A0A521DHT5_9SPHI|nr:hypothetical protein [Pedobacter westerhofensis]SMO71145.1 hypothetical protein SAMN06265348_105419 [Pedobacter westerhofensis]